MFCPACGTQSLAEAAFCVQCGTRLSNTSATPASPMSGGNPSPTSKVTITPPDVNIKLGGFWKRSLASAIDIFILSSTGLLLFFLLIDKLDEIQSINAKAWFWFAFYLLFLLYWPLFEASPLQATVGKKLLGIKVTGMNGNRIGLIRSCWRTAAKTLSALTFFIGVLRIGWSQNKQGLHDYLAETFVVETKATASQVNQQLTPRTKPTPHWLIFLCACFAVLIIFGYADLIFPAPVDEPFLSGKALEPAR
jgi:uncharacterized RDD family membrane protein YckC